MHIVVKTYDEVSAERVTIEVAAGQKVEIQAIDGATSTVRACEGSGCPRMADVRQERDTFKHQAYSENERAARLTVQVRELGKFKDRVIDELISEGDRLRDKITELIGKVEGYNTDRRTERDRADSMSRELGHLRTANKTLSRQLAAAEEGNRSLASRHQRELGAERDRYQMLTQDLLTAKTQIEMANKTLTQELLDAKTQAQTAVSEAWGYQSRISKSTEVLFTPEVDTMLAKLRSEAYSIQQETALGNVVRAAREALGPIGSINTVDLLPKVKKALQVLNRPGVRGAVHAAQSGTARTLAAAIEETREVLDLDDPDSTTSQA